MNSEPMKILQIIPVLSPNYGGPITVLYQLSKGLSKKNHLVTILTSEFGYDNNLAKKFVNAGIAVIPIHSILNFGLFIFTPSVKKWLIENLKTFDIIHMHTFRSYQNAQVCEYAQKYNIPYIVQAHGSVLPFFQKQFLKQAFDRMWGNKILQNASKCIALTKTESDQYIKMGVPEEKIVIIPNGLDLSQFSNLPEKGTFRKKYGISDNEQIILFLGRIHKIKGIDLLIDAYWQVLEELPHARLVIAGPDEGYLLIIQEQIQRLKLKRVPLITGPLYDRDKLEAYVDADVYVLPSIHDAFPYTVLEAWACGTPVVVTIGCHIADVVKKAGIVVERDPVELAEVLKKIISDDKLQRKFTEKGKLIVNNEFNLAKTSLSVEKLYIQLLKENLGNI